MTRRTSDFCISKFWSQNLRLCLTIGSVVLGGTLGFTLRPMNLSPNTQQLVNFPGEIFLQVLKLMVLPLIFSSLISALGQMNAKESAQIGIVTFMYYLCTATLAISLGIFLVLTIHPGNPAKSSPTTVEEVSSRNTVSSLDTFLDLIRNMFPENLIQATFERSQTTKSEKVVEENGTKSTTSDKVIVSQRGLNILGLIVFCVGFGINVSKLGEKTRIIVDLFIAIDAVIFEWINTLMWFAPIGICSLICGNLLEMDDISNTAAILALYVSTVLLGITIHTVFTVPLIYFLSTQRNPMFIVRGMIQPFITAFGTSSSGAALPIAIQCAEEHCRIDSRVARFVLPLGGTINMDGTALYEAVAVVFIAQLNNIQLSIAEVLTISITATIGSLGMNSVPAGLVSILPILSIVGLPIKDVYLLLTVDWFIDRVRTACNTLSDGFAAGVVSKILKENLDRSQAMDEKQSQINELEMFTTSQQYMATHQNEADHSNAAMDTTQS